MTTASPQLLVVEDEPDLADLYREWLDDAFEVHVAYGGRAALEELDDAIDVVLLDRRIPDLSGDEVLDEIRARELECRVAMVTAVEPGEDIIEMGFDDYLVKPVDHEALNAAVDRLLRRSTHTEDVRELFALASKKAVLEAETTPAERAASQAYAELERQLREKSQAIEARHAELDHQDFEVLFYDLEDDRPADVAT